MTGTATARPVQTLPERDHLEGCPGARIERYPVTKPRRASDEDGNVSVVHRTVSVVRCVECGGQRVLDDPLAIKATVLDPEGA